MARQIVRHRYWRHRNQEHVRGIRRAAYRRHAKAYTAATRRYEAAHPGYKQERDRKSNQRLTDCVVAARLRRRGILNPSASQIEAKRLGLRALRAVRSMRMLNLCASLMKK